jgi:hypothetical protein
MGVIMLTHSRYSFFLTLVAISCTAKQKEKTSAIKEWTAEAERWRRFGTRCWVTSQAKEVLDVYGHINPLPR